MNRMEMSTYLFYITLFSMVMAWTVGQTINQIERFCFIDANRIQAMFMMGDYLLFRMNPTTPYRLYHWRSGHLLSSAWNQHDLFVNVSTQHYRLQYLTTMDLCELFSIVSPSVIQQTKHKRSILDNDIVHSLASDLQQLIIDPEKMTGVNDMNNHFRHSPLNKDPYVDVKKYDDIKSQLEMFEARLRTISDRLLQPSSGTMTKPSCGQLIVATFCHFERSFENDICHDSFEQTSKNQQVCWPKTMFYQYLHNDNPSHQLRLIPIPFKYSLMSNLLLLRGLFQMSDPRRFVQISSRLRCHNDKTILARTLIDVIDLHRDDLISGFHLDQFDFLQSRMITGHLEYLDSTKISMAEFFNCFGNSSAIQRPLALQYDHRQPQATNDQIVKVIANKPTYIKPISETVISQSPPKQLARSKVKLDHHTIRSVKMRTSKTLPPKKRQSPTTATFMKTKAIEHRTMMTTITTKTFIANDDEHQAIDTWIYNHHPHQAIERSFERQIDHIVPAATESAKTTTDDEVNHSEPQNVTVNSTQFYEHLIKFKTSQKSKLIIIIIITVLIMAGCLMRRNRHKNTGKDVSFHHDDLSHNYRHWKKKSKSSSEKRSKKPNRIEQNGKSNNTNDGPFEKNIIVMDVKNMQQSSLFDQSFTDRIQTMVDESQLITKMMNQPYKAIYETVSSIRPCLRPIESPPTTSLTLMPELSPPLEPMIEAGDESINFDNNNGLKPINTTINDSIYETIEDENTRLIYILHRLTKSLHIS